MRRVEVLYWTITGAMMGFGLIGLMTIGFPFLIVGLVMAFIGLWKPGISRAWAALIGFGGLPALFFLSHMIDSARSAVNPYCNITGPNTGEINIPPEVSMVECSYSPASYYVMFAVFAAITLLGVCLGLLLRARSDTTAA
ncbi:MAG TPA: hypothetical protein VHM16_04425 [Rubrobacteraceae bacterium]|nr:hypothetical protein [Rubrobacteraceae bacterium]